MTEEELMHLRLQPDPVCDLCHKLGTMVVGCHGHSAFDGLYILRDTVM